MMRISLAFLLALFVIQANAASLYAGGLDEIRVYDPSTGALESSFQAPNEGGGRGFAFGSDDLLSWGYESRIGAFDPLTGTLQSFINTAESNLELAFGPGGLLYATAGTFSAGIRVYDPLTGILQSTIDTPNQQNQELAFHPI